MIRKKFNETALPGKDDFYNHLNGRRLCAPKRFCKDFEKKKRILENIMICMFKVIL